MCVGQRPAILTYRKTTIAERGYISPSAVIPPRPRYLRSGTGRLAPLSVLRFSPLARGRTDEAGRAMTKPLHVFIRKQGNHFRVLYQRHYPNGLLEEVMLTQRFETADEAQSYADSGLRAQRIYRALTPRRSPASHPHIDLWKR